jgi:hypothetical protein
MGEKRPPAARQPVTKTSCLSETYAEDVRKLVQGKPAHLTLQRNPIKDESLPNIILFSFVTVVSLEILVTELYLIK